MHKKVVIEFGFVEAARSHKLSETVVVYASVRKLGLVTLERERKESSIVVVVAGNLAVQAPPISVTRRLTAAAYFKARNHSIFSAEDATYHSIT